MFVSSNLRLIKDVVYLDFTYLTLECAPAIVEDSIVTTVS